MQKSLIGFCVSSVLFCSDYTPAFDGCVLGAVNLHKNLGAFSQKHPEFEVKVYLGLDLGYCWVRYCINGLSFFSDI